MHKLLLISLLLILAILPAMSGSASPAPDTKTDWWSSQKKGANIFNKKISDDVYGAASASGIQFVRIATDKWSGTGRDFLIGNADNYESIPKADLEKLRKELENFDKQGVKVVLTMLSLPGCRWKQNNDDINDFRLWKQNSYWEQSIKFWGDLARELKGNKAIAAYNILNEPRPEFMWKYYSWEEMDTEKYISATRNTFADLNLFYERVVKAIRKVDKDVPIIIDAGMNADPRAISCLRPLFDKNVLYAFHMYEPYSYTNKKLNGGKFFYPGENYIDKLKYKVKFNKNFIYNIYIKPVVEWQKKYKIPSNRIIAEEFGCSRTSKGADKYLNDLIELFDSNGWHWAFYSFREDEWDDMDYELGSEPLGWKYWQDVEAGKNPEKPRKPNKIWEMITVKLKSGPQPGAK